MSLVGFYVSLSGYHKVLMGFQINYFVKIELVVVKLRRSWRSTRGDKNGKLGNISELEAFYLR